MPWSAEPAYSNIKETSGRATAPSPPVYVLQYNIKVGHRVLCAWRPIAAQFSHNTQEREKVPVDKTKWTFLKESFPSKCKMKPAY